MFKITRVMLAAGERIELRTSFSLAVHTTRVPQPGKHAVDVIVNGNAMHAGAFSVVATITR